jgi:hypothetical protein
VNQNASILAVRIQSELIEIEQIVERAQRLLAKAIESGDEDYYDGVALNLHSFYTAIERILEDIAKEIDGAIPTGQNWHRSLLMQMAAEVPQIRPPVIQRSSRDCLDDYRGLRHVIRNVYSFNLKPVRLQELVTTLSDCYQSIASDLTHFCQFLTTVTESGGS